MAPQQLPKDWTAEELVAELRRRERSERKMGGGVDQAAARMRLAAPAAGPTRELHELPTAAVAQLALDRQRAIYGVDNRQDLYQVKKVAVRKAADAVAALVAVGDLTATADGGFTLKTTSYRDDYQLCGNEPFVAQPLGCFCSGFLVAADVIATAGHCVKSAAGLARMRFVFGFRMENADTARTRFARADVYQGVKVLGRSLASDGTDWALVRLDRAVTGRQPLKFRTTGKVKIGQELFVIGHPCGLPQKYAPGAVVRHNSAPPFFVANLDTYGGNSGSPVFDAGTGVVEGILVRGENDFVTNGTCYVSLVCPTSGCRGEDVTRATVWSAKVPKSTVPKKAAAGKKRAARAGAARSRSTRGAR